MLGCCDYWTYGCGDGGVIDAPEMVDSIAGAASWGVVGASRCPLAIRVHAAQGDCLVRSHAGELKRRFGDEEVLQYLLIDGRFQGAVLGHWRIGPYDVSDIKVELPAAERSRRRDEIVAVVARQYRPPRHHIQRYGGKALPKRLQPTSD